MALLFLDSSILIFLMALFCNSDGSFSPILDSYFIYFFLSLMALFFGNPVGSFLFNIVRSMALLIAITSNAIRYQKTSIWNLWNNDAPTLAKSWKKHQIERLKIHKIMENDNLEVKSIIARQKHSGGCPVSLAELSRGSSSSCPCNLPWASSCTPLHIPWTERASL